MQHKPKTYRKRWIERAGSELSRYAVKLIPDAFLIAILLTILSFVLGFFVLSLQADQTPSLRPLLLGWFQGFSDIGLLGFGFQMALVLVTGHALATAPPVEALLKKVARLPKTAAGATALVAFVAILAGILHWGLAAVVGALLVREMRRSSHLKLHLPLLAASAYLGMAIWHGGLSGSAPLKIAEPEHFLHSISGQIPISETLGSVLNISVTLGLMLLFLALSALLLPSDPKERLWPDTSPDTSPKEDVESEVRPKPQAPKASLWHERWLSSRWASSLLGGLILGLLIMGFLGPLPFDLNSLNLSFFALGILAHQSMARWLSAVAEAALGAGMILVQFPLYFGILGILQSSGAVVMLSEFLISISNPQTFPVFAYWSSALTNIFIPSGGGQWAIQGEILLNAGKSLGVDPRLTVMAFAYGDGITNLLQPFWALPLLAITGTQARDIMGYTTIYLIFGGLLTSFLLFLFA